MRMYIAAFGLVLMALGWMNATVSGRNPGLLFIGFVLVLASRRANADDLAIAAGLLVLPVLHWFYMEGLYQGPICSEESGCHESWKLPDAIRMLVELVPYLIITWLAWRLARGRTPTLVPAQERSLL